MFSLRHVFIDRKGCQFEAKILFNSYIHSHIRNMCIFTALCGFTSPLEIVYRMCNNVPKFIGTNIFMHLHILFFLIQASQAVDLKVKAENQAVDERNTQVDQGEN